jgi:transposase
MKQKKYPPELRERAVRMLFEHESEHASRWAATQSVAAKVGCSTEALRSWVRQADEAKSSPGLAAERERVKALEREVRELRQANEILRKASAYFAQAELDRRFKP